MFKIGDNIIYGVSGVMTVMDLRRERITGEEKTYYLLSEYGKTNSSITYVPVDNEKLISGMHHLLSKDEILAAISRASELSDLEWIADNRQRAEAYRGILRSMDRLSILVMIRTIHNTGLRRAAMGKKNFLADEGVMQNAERILIEEFSIVLCISKDEVRNILDREIKGL
jgi:CarD family transcriptional regulator